MNILVIGGTGHVGSEVVNALGGSARFWRSLEPLIQRAN
jgi:uncharacterized protein YbjT (DUF2867 family)